MRSSRFAGHVAALALCIAAACSSSSSTPIPKGNLEIEGGPMDSSTDVTVDDGPEGDASTDSTEPADSSQIGPSDAAPVDAAFACANPASISDCGYCLNKPACMACAFAVVPSTATQLKTLLQCTECTACYTACNGALTGCSAPSPPNNCDTTGASDDNCGQCTACAVSPAPIDAQADGFCQSFQQTCLMSPSCNVLLGKVRSTCQIP
jgi:hypothetical protein